VSQGARFWVGGRAPAPPSPLSPPPLFSRCSPRPSSRRSARPGGKGEGGRGGTGGGSGQENQQGWGRPSTPISLSRPRTQPPFASSPSRHDRRGAACSGKRRRGRRKHRAPLRGLISRPPLSHLLRQLWPGTRLYPVSHDRLSGACVCEREKGGGGWDARGSTESVKRGPAKGKTLSLQEKKTQGKSARPLPPHTLPRSPPPAHTLSVRAQQAPTKAHTHAEASHSFSFPCAIAAISRASKLLQLINFRE